MITTTTHTVENRQITAYLDIVSAESVQGVNVVRDVFAGMRDFFGGRSQTLERALQEARIQATDEIKERARALQADAVVGLDYQISMPAGKGGMVIWPVHCVTGTWGHNIHSDVARSLAAWELAHQRAVTKVLKGEYPLSEHFGVFEADAPVPSVPGTQFNTVLAASLAHAADVIAIAGEASSHCVAASYDQFMRYLASVAAPAPRVVLLQDAMSPVTGFEPMAAALFERARAAGTQVMSVDAFASSLQ